MTYLTDLAIIERKAGENEKSNEAFKHWLKGLPGTQLDTLVNELNATIAPHIDCTACGNCCRNLMINIEEVSITALAKRLGISTQAFKKAYVEQGSGMMVMNRIPCHFLHENKCTVYADRPMGCRSFPNLDQPGFQGRLFATFMHYSMCPIIFNVIEALKTRTHFTLNTP